MAEKKKARQKQCDGTNCKYAEALREGIDEPIPDPERILQVKKKLYRAWQLAQAGMLLSVCITAETVDGQYVALFSDFEDRFGMAGFNASVAAALTQDGELYMDGEDFDFTRERDEEENESD